MKDRLAGILNAVEAIGRTGAQLDDAQLWINACTASGGLLAGEPDEVIMVQLREAYRTGLGRACHGHAARVLAGETSPAQIDQAAALAVGVDLAGIRAYADSMTDLADLRGFVNILAATLARRIADVCPVDVRGYLALGDDARDEAREEARAAAVKAANEAGERAAQLYRAEVAVRVREEFPEAARIFYYTKRSSTSDSRFSVVTSVVDIHENALRPADGTHIDDWADDADVNPLIAQAAALSDEPEDEEDEITIMDILPWLEQAAQG